MSRFPCMVAVLTAALALGPARVDAHSTGPARPDEFIQGAFSPAFVPPEPGSYELPRIRRVAALTLRDAAGRLVDTRSVMAGKIAVVSFIYTACPDRLGCPLASSTLRDLQSRLQESELAGRATLVTIPRRRGASSTRCWRATGRIGRPSGTSTAGSPDGSATC